MREIIEKLASAKNLPPRIDAYCHSLLIMFYMKLVYYINANKLHNDKPVMLAYYSFESKEASWKNIKNLLRICLTKTRFNYNIEEKHYIVEIMEQCFDEVTKGITGKLVLDYFNYRII